MGVTVTSMSMSNNNNKIKFCGSLSSWYMQDDTAFRVDFYEASHYLSTRDYAFFAHYSLEGNHTHYESGTSNVIRCLAAYAKMCFLDSTIMTTGWKVTTIKNTWHIISHYQYKQIRVHCKNEESVDMLKEFQ